MHFILFFWDFNYFSSEFIILCSELLTEGFFFFFIPMEKKYFHNESGQCYVVGLVGRSVI